MWCRRAIGSLATGSVTFQMCVGAIVFLMLGQMFGMRPAFLIASGTVLAIAAAFALGLLGAVQSPQSHAAEAAFRSLVDAAWTAVRGDVAGDAGDLPGVVPAAADVSNVHDVVLPARHRTVRSSPEGCDHRHDRVGGRGCDWCAARRIHRQPLRPAEHHALGFALVAACLFALNRVTTIAQATPLLALASASWTLPAVNAYPLFVEPVPKERRGALTAPLSAVHGAGRRDWRSVEWGHLRCGEQLSAALPLDEHLYGAGLRTAVLFIPHGSGGADTVVWRRCGEVSP